MAVNIQTGVNILDINIQAEVDVLDQDIEVDFSSSIIHAFSPTATIVQLSDGTGYLITITDKNGTTSAKIPVVTQENIDRIIANYFQTNPIIEQYIQQHNISNQAHADIRTLIQSQVERINTSISALEVSKITYFSDTTTNWAAKTSLVSSAGVFYIYTDYETIVQGGKRINVAGVKIGDGTTYVVDLPFVTVTTEEKQFWNNKVRCYLSSLDTENLVFTTN